MKSLNLTTEPQRTQRNPTLTPTPTLSLRARESGERGKKNIFPVMLSLSKHLLTLCTVFIISACGGGGGGGGNGPTSPSATASFSGSTPGSNTVYMIKNSSLSSGSLLAVDVKVNSVSNVYGAAFDVDFDSSKMTCSSYVKGDFLGTVEPNVILQSGSSNKLVVGVSKQGTATGATGSGTLVTLKFNVTSGGSLAFSNAALKDPSNLTISGITWTGGTVTVQ